MVEFDSVTTNTSEDFFRQITRYSIGLFFHSLPAAAGPPGGGLNNAQPALIRW